jgi:Fe-S-cluster containining protein
VDKASNPSADGELIAIVDAALLEAKRLAREWIACRPGCAQCCEGAFAISALDLQRLRAGMAALEAADPARAARVRTRASAWIDRQAAAFPGDPGAGVLDEGPEAEARFDDFADDEPCPALDPETRTCDLYASRPFPCRVFGPPLRLGEDAIAVCELCFEDASDEQIAACEVASPAAAIEERLAAALGGGRTVVAYAVR